MEIDANLVINKLMEELSKIKMENIILKIQLEEFTKTNEEKKTSPGVDKGA